MDSSQTIQHEVGDLIDFREFDPLFTSDSTAITLINSPPKAQATPRTESPIPCSSPDQPQTKILPKPNPISAPPEPHKNSFLPKFSPLGSLSPKSTPKIIINSHTKQLAFDPQHVDFFFNKFESLHRHEQLNNAELFDQLLQCLNHQQQSRMYRSISEGSGDYFQLKSALIQTYGRTLEQAQEELTFAPGLGDKMPTELLAQLRSILGRHLRENPLLSHSLKREFLARLPTYARDPLIIMRNVDLDDMAEQADALVRDRKRNTIFDEQKRNPYSRAANQQTNPNPNSSYDTPVMEHVLTMLQNINAKMQNTANNTNSNIFQNPPQSRQPHPTPSRPHNGFQSLPAPGPHQPPPPQRFQQPTSRPPFQPNRGHQRPPPPPKQNFNSFHSCWYHQQFGTAARNCTPDCHYYNERRHKNPTFNSSPPLNFKGDAPHHFPRFSQ